jgi:hypothetical protein
MDRTSRPLVRRIEAMHIGTMPKVYSYTRFSTPEQAAGDSLRRQTEAAQRWAASRGLELDTRLSLSDLGVSAYRGTNTGEDQGLGGFIFACRAGLIEAGSFLLVESLDRISRMSPRRAQRLLDDIVDCGVTIVSLSDGQEYSAERLDNDPMALMVALMVAWRAHEDQGEGSPCCRCVGGEAPQGQGREALKLTERAPAWLRWDGQGWAVDEAKAATVRRVYALALAGHGEHKIAVMLNEEGVPVLGRGKMWHRSSVAKLLRNAAVVGRLVPGRIEFHDGKRQRVLEEAIEGPSRRSFLLRTGEPLGRSRMAPPAAPVDDMGPARYGPSLLALRAVLTVARP